MRGGGTTAVKKATSKIQYNVNRKLKKQEDCGLRQMDFVKTTPTPLDALT